MLLEQVDDRVGVIPGNVDALLDEAAEGGYRRALAPVRAGAELALAEDVLKDLGDRPRRLAVDLVAVGLPPDLEPVAEELDLGGCDGVSHRHPPRVRRSAMVYSASRRRCFSSSSSAASSSFSSRSLRFSCSSSAMRTASGFRARLRASTPSPFDPQGRDPEDGEEGE